MSTVSVIVPVYNGAMYISHCIENLKQQTLENIEIILIDDGSHDDTLTILRSYECSQIQVLHQENAGAGTARNLGLAHAAGEYIAFLDVDDVFAEKETLEKLYRKAKEHQALICGGSFLKESGSFNPEDKRMFRSEGWVNFSEYQFDFGFQRFIFYRQLLIDNYITFPQYRIFEDPVFLLRAMVMAKRFYAIPDGVYLYSGAHQTTISCEKAIDYLHGLRDNLKVTHQYGLVQLHVENVHRLETLGSYYAESSFSSGSEELFSALIEANCSVSQSLLHNAGIEKVQPYLIPALQTVWVAANRYFKLRHTLLFWKRPQ